ncbi:MAG TPA: DUF4190 domain-containing protein [Mycobacteriales bacterium]|nr:DUF4190 domain-containing protein [Mycobacteriales bacterium]
MTTPPQYSPDGQWWWDGERWVPAAQATTPSHPTPPPWATPQQQQPSSYPQAQGWSPYPGAPTPTDHKAIGSLVASLLWLCGVGSVAGIVLGHLSRSGAKREGRTPSGLGTAGMVLGYLGLLATALLAVLVYTVKDPFVGAVKNDLELQSASDAQQAFHDASGRYALTVEDLRQYGYDDFDGDVDVTVVSATATSYCLTTRAFGEDLYVSDERPETSTDSCR